jgi:SAM-dependent methyltransferase
MGCGMPYLRALERRGAFKGGRASVLDIGSSYLLAAPEEELLDLFRVYGSRPLDDRLRAKARELSARSYPGSPYGFTYLGEVFAETTVRYLAFDIFQAPGTRIFDLNREGLPPDLAGRFDLVLNFGTTEHVLNQFNAFKVIHEALAPGGLAFHQLPMTGWFDHGYFNYNPRLFADLAAANRYDLERLDFSEPQGFWRVEEWVKLPANAKNPVDFQTSLALLGESSPAVPNGLVNVLVRKTQVAPFRLPLDVLTSGGEIDGRVANDHGPAQGAPPGVARRVVRKFRRTAGKLLRAAGLRR